MRKAKTTTSLRNSYSAVEKDKFVQKFLKSGLKKEQFCLVEGISKSSLYRWHRDFKSRSKKSSFMPISVTDSDEKKPKAHSACLSISSSTNLTIKLGANVEIIAPPRFDLKQLASLLKEVAQ
jgi:transposase-like protein